MGQVCTICRFWGREGYGEVKVSILGVREAVGCEKITIIFKEIEKYKYNNNNSLFSSSKEE